MGKQTDIQGQATHDKDDKHPYTKKIQVAKTAESSMKKPQRKPQRIGAVAAKKHVTIFTIKERRKKSSIKSSGTR